jgi:hypothetical protein
LNYLIAAVLLAISMGSSAMSLGQYNEARSDERQWAHVKEYLNGLGDGMTVSSAALIQQGRVPLYCLPKEKVLNHDNYISLLDTFITANAFLPELPIESILLKSLISAFPCPKAQ